MSNDVFFEIEGKKLYLDKVLVEYDNSAVFFVCKSGERYYICLNIDIDNDRYIVEEIELLDLVKMLEGKVSMRDTLLKVKYFWEITASDNYMNDQVERKVINDISMQCLPYEGRTYKIATNEMRQYCKDLNDKLYSDSDLEWNTFMTSLVDSIIQREFKRVEKTYNETYFSMHLWNKEIDNFKSSTEMECCIESDYQKLVAL